MDGHGVVAQLCGFGTNGRGEGDFWRFSKVSGCGGLARFGRDVEAQGAYGGTTCLRQVDALVFMKLLYPRNAGLVGCSFNWLGRSPRKALGVKCWRGLRSRVPLEEGLQGVQRGLGLVGLTAPLLGDEADFCRPLAQVGLRLVVSLKHDRGKALLHQFLPLLFEIGQHGLCVSLNVLEQLTQCRFPFSLSLLTLNVAPNVPLSVSSS